MSTDLEFEISRPEKSAAQVEGLMPEAIERAGVAESLSAELHSDVTVRLPSAEDWARSQR